MKTDDYKKTRSNKREIKALKYKLNGKEKMIHQYEDDDFLPNISMIQRKNASKKKLSTYQNWIIKAMSKEKENVCYRLEKCNYCLDAQDEIEKLKLILQECKLKKLMLDKLMPQESIFLFIDQ